MRTHLPPKTVERFPWWVQLEFIRCLASVPRGFVAIPIDDPRRYGERLEVHLFSVRRPEMSTKLSFHISSWENGVCSAAWATDFSDELAGACARLNEGVNVTEADPDIRPDVLEARVSKYVPSLAAGMDPIDVEATHGPY